MPMDCKYDSSSEQSLDHHQIIRSSAPYQILMVLYNVLHVKMILLLNNRQIIRSLSDLWGCFTM